MTIGEAKKFLSRVLDSKVNVVDAPDKDQYEAYTNCWYMDNNQLDRIRRRMVVYFIAVCDGKLLLRIKL